MVDLRCPYCMNLIKEIESCPECGNPMVFRSEEGPMGTWECSLCSTPKQKVGFRRTPLGLLKVNDLVGRYAPKDGEESR